MREATTFDLYVLDVHSRWVKYQENKQKAISEGKSLPVNNHGLSVEQMKSMVADAKKRKGVKKGA